MLIFHATFKTLVASRKLATLPLSGLRVVCCLWLLPRCQLLQPHKFFNPVNVLSLHHLALKLLQLSFQDQDIFTYHLNGFGT